MKTAIALFIALLLWNFVAFDATGASSPTLSVSRGDRSIQLSWPATAADYVLESAPKLADPTAWRAVAERPTLTNAEFKLTISIKNDVQFFRLGLAAPALPAENFVIGEYTLVSSRNISASVFEDTYQANVSNWGEADATITATLSSTNPSLSIVTGSLSFGAVSAGATGESLDTFTVRYDEDHAIDDSAFSWSVVATPLPPTSFALIDKALADGLINAETALIYKVYVEFSDDRLPAPYFGRDDGFFEARAFMEAAGQFDTLSPAAQKILAPFRIRPDQPGSWYELRTQQNARGLQTATPPPASNWIIESRPDVNVYWDQALRPNDGIKAKVFANELQRVWPKLTNLLGAPLSVTNTGTNGPITVVMVDMATITKNAGKDALAYSDTYSTVCKDRQPGAMVVNTTSDFATLVHEFAHVILFRYKLKTGCHSPEYSWLHEATATWVEHFIYPDGSVTYPAGNRGNSEHEYSSKFLGRPQLELEFLDRRHEYGAYLWFLFITRGVDAGAHFVRETWDACATQDSLGAINASILNLGGFDKQWPEFVLYNWNRKKIIVSRAPAKEQPYRYYATWDNLQKQAREVTPTPIQVKLNGGTSATYSVRHVIPHLAARYFHYDFRADDTVRSLTFTHPYWSGSEPTARVQAIVKIRGKDWKPAEDWTSIQKKYLCRDRPEEDVEELVIVISNGKFTDRNHVLDDDTAELKVFALGCNPWVGSIQFSYTNSLNVFGATEAVTEIATATNVVFSLIDPEMGNYQATSGLVTWTHTGTFNGGGLQCAGEATGTFLVAAGDSTMTVTTFSPPAGDDSTLFYSAAGDVNVLQATIDFVMYPCNQGFYFPQQQQLYRKWLLTNAHIPFAGFDKIVVDPQGDLIMSGNSKQGAHRWHWDFKQVRKTR